MRANRVSISSGYSLIELVIVGAIVTVLSAIVVPRYSATRDRYRVEMAARCIAGDLNLARSQAKQTSAPQIVIFDIATSTYAMNGIRSLDGKSSNSLVNLAGDPFDSTLVSVNLAGTTQITYDAYGSADHGGQIVVRSNGAQTTVTIEATSGKATVP
ncbi:MAG TPA: GspH/FimT family pseudopilin [Tepidisphaeraceae bacterium]|jgi:Tfp pilus assembly protein FimT|nr:GspH/FimT family pseudopilin [Tepidisphaeraceae bacterium]